MLSSLLMDGRATESFEEWCGEYGYDTDSRRALELYLRLQEIGKRLRVFLGMTAEQAVEKYGNGDAEAAAAALTAAPAEVR